MLRGQICGLFATVQGHTELGMMVPSGMLCPDRKDMGRAHEEAGCMARFTIFSKLFKSETNETHEPVGARHAVPWPRENGQALRQVRCMTL